MNMPVSIGMRRVSDGLEDIVMDIGYFWLTMTGNWIAPTKIPDQSLESRMTRLEGKQKRRSSPWLAGSCAGFQKIAHQHRIFLMKSLWVHICSTPDQQANHTVGPKRMVTPRRA
jgi:hypothetical protein